MGLTQKCLNLLRLKQICSPKLTFGKPLEEQLKDAYPEQNVINYLKSWNKNLKQDDYGNLYLINPGTPLLSAHMDTVQREQHTVGMPHIHINKKKGTISYKDSIIGGDDKCGIALAMQLYEKYGDKVSLLFSRQEEVGHLGASYFCRNSCDLLQQCKYCLVLDRRNAGDIIGNSNGYCSDEFEDEIYRCTKDFGYKPTSGSLSDADAYSKYINCVNLSVGYYKAHTEDEYIVIEELKNAFNAVCNIIENFQGEYEIYKEPEKKSYSYNYYSGYGHSSYYGYDWNKEYDGSRSNSRTSYKKKTEAKKPEPKSNGISKEAEYTRGFFKIRNNGKLEIKEDVILVDPNGIEPELYIPQGVYEVMSRDDYQMYQDEQEYNKAFSTCTYQNETDNEYDY